MVSLRMEYGSSPSHPGKREFLPVRQFPGIQNSSVPLITPTKRLNRDLGSTSRNVGHQKGNEQELVEEFPHKFDNVPLFLGIHRVRSSPFRARQPVLSGYTFRLKKQRREERLNPTNKGNSVSSFSSNRNFSIGKDRMGSQEEADEQAKGEKRVFKL